MTDVEGDKEKGEEDVIKDDLNRFWYIYRGWIVIMCTYVEYFQHNLTKH